MRGRAKSAILPVLALLPALLVLAASCGDDDSPAAPGGDDPFVAATPESLLTFVFENAYNTRDSLRYEAMLDENYTFECLPRDRDNPYIFDSWDKSEDLDITGRMFSGWMSPDGVRVVDIDLDIVFLGETVSDDTLPDHPNGETWKKCVTEVDMTVLTQDPRSTDGSGLVNRIVFSNQDFLVKPDPRHAGRWVIRRQVDRPAITKWATEETNWGKIKQEFRVEEAPTNRSTPEELLTSAFEDAYNGRDGSAYADLLAAGYEFENLPENPDDPLHVVVWDRDEELLIAGRMFSGWTNGDGIRVLDIDLDITFFGQTVSGDTLPDHPEGETWYKAVTEVGLEVVTADPSAGDGSGIVDRLVECNQDFIVKPVGGLDSLWAIRRQLDRPAITKGEAEEKASWGAIKGLFR